MEFTAEKSLLLSVTNLRVCETFEEYFNIKLLTWIFLAFKTTVSNHTIETNTLKAGENKKFVAVNNNTHNDFIKSKSESKFVVAQKIIDVVSSNNVSKVFMAIIRTPKI